MFTVEGKLGSAAYTVQVGGEQPQLGQVSGTENIMYCLMLKDGDPYAATPTGPFGRLDCDNPASVLGALLDWTKVDSIHGDAPDILGGQRAEQGVVY